MSGINSPPMTFSGSNVSPRIKLPSRGSLNPARKSEIVRTRTGPQGETRETTVTRTFEPVEEEEVRSTLLPSRTTYTYSSEEEEEAPVEKTSYSSEEEEEETSLPSGRPTNLRTHKSYLSNRENEEETTTSLGKPLSSRTYSRYSTKEEEETALPAVKPLISRSRRSYPTEKTLGLPAEETSLPSPFRFANASGGPRSRVYETSTTSSSPRKTRSRSSRGIPLVTLQNIAKILDLPVSGRKDTLIRSIVDSLEEEF